MRRAVIVILVLCGLICLAGCRKEKKEAGREVIYMKANGADMVWVEGTGPCVLAGITDEQKEMLAGRKTGDVLLAEISKIEELYPGNCYVEKLEFVREGSEDTLDVKELQHLRSMGWYVITEDHPDGLPLYDFSLVWGVYGISSYESSDGKLVKTKDATHPEDFVTTHLLTGEERKAVWTALMNMNYASLPKEYDPFDGLRSEPNQTIELVLTVEGETYEIYCRHIALGDASDAPASGKDFVRGVDAIVKVLRETEEWKALPDYEFLYD